MEVINKFIFKEELKREVKIEGPFTMVTLTTPFDMKAVGISKKSAEDKQSSKRGLAIATGRAMKSLINKLNKVKTQHHYMG